MRVRPLDRSGNTSKWSLLVASRSDSCFIDTRTRPARFLPILRTLNDGVPHSTRIGPGRFLTSPRCSDAGAFSRLRRNSSDAQPSRRASAQARSRSARPWPARGPVCRQPRRAGNLQSTHRTRRVRKRIEETLIRALKTLGVTHSKCVSLTASGVEQFPTKGHNHVNVPREGLRDW